MRVYTFFEEAGVNADAQWLLARWKANWQARGFEPVILGDADARRHPRYDHYVRRFSEYPTVNPKAYEMTCFKRWLAMAMVGGLMVDYDLFNLYFSGPACPELTFFERNRVPCCVMGSKDDYGRILDILYNFQPPAGMTTISDMYILTEQRDIKTMDLVGEFGEIGNRPLIHFANASCGGNKRKAILEFFAP